MDRPHAILFACTYNAVRSPMAEALLKCLHGRDIWVQSAGVCPEGANPFAVAVMNEIGIDLSRHHPRGFDDLVGDSFDLVIALSPEAHQKALQVTRLTACEVESWDMMDPSMVEGDRETQLDAYRRLREALRQRILARFPLATPSGTGFV